MATPISRRPARVLLLRAAEVPTHLDAGHEMRPDMDGWEIARYNRRVAPSHLSRTGVASLYELVHAGNEAG